MRIRLLAALLLASTMFVAVSESQAIAGPPPLGSCPTSIDPSGTCPPDQSQYINAYTWAYNGAHGGSSVDFDSSMPTSFADFQTTCSSDPNNSSYYQLYSTCSVPSPSGTGGAPNSKIAWFSASQVSVSSGELHLGSSWTSGITDCNDYWGYVVGIDGGPNNPAAGCWATGTVEQQTSVWPWPSGATEHFAFEAKWTGTSDIPDLDSTLQASSDFPPEVDVVETDTPATGFNTFVHCAPSSQDQKSTSINQTSWNVYEFDLTSTDVYIYVDGVLEWTLARSSSNCTGASGQANSDWLPYSPSGATDLGAFMEAVMGTNGSYPGSTWDTKNQSIQVDWVAEN